MLHELLFRAMFLFRTCSLPRIISVNLFIGVPLTLSVRRLPIDGFYTLLPERRLCHGCAISFEEFCQSSITKFFVQDKLLSIMLHVFIAAAAVAAPCSWPFVRSFDPTYNIMLLVLYIQMSRFHSRALYTSGLLCHSFTPTLVWRDDSQRTYREVHDALYDA